MSSKNITGRILAFSVFFLVSISFIGDAFSPVSSTTTQNVFQYDSYRESCVDAEKIVWIGMKNIIRKHENAQAQLLRLLFHDCFIHTGGPYYPVLTGRKDSNHSYYNEAAAEIPKPESNILQTLQLFAQRGFNERETTTLLGSHNIGRISCEFIKPRLNMSDGAIPLDFLLEMRMKCRDNNGSMSNKDTPSSRGVFGSHYYQALIKGKGLLTSDQELMSNEKTAKAVLEYAEDGNKFRFDFASVMVKLSNLNVLVGSKGEVR